MTRLEQEKIRLRSLKEYLIYSKHQGSATCKMTKPVMSCQQWFIFKAGLWKDYIFRVFYYHTILKVKIKWKKKSNILSKSIFPTS